MQHVDKREFEWADNSRLLETQHSATQHQNQHQHHHHQQQHHQFLQQHQRYFTLQQTALPQPQSAHQQPTTPRHMQFATSCVQLTSANANRSALAHQQQQQQQQQESCNLEKEKESFKLVEKLQPKKSRTKYTKDQVRYLIQLQFKILKKANVFVMSKIYTLLLQFIN